MFLAHVMPSKANLGFVLGHIRILDTNCNMLVPLMQNVHIGGSDQHEAPKANGLAF